MITADQIVAHLVGDYLLQSDWMANEKTKKNMAAAAHAIAYSLPFLFLRPSLAAWVFIVGTHFVIDRWRLARYVCWAKNFLAPRWTRNLTAIGSPFEKPSPIDFIWWNTWSECSGTGYHKDRPAWLAVWLMIIADNTLHILCNGIALRFLRP
jgi:hypothetical protein